MKDTGTTLDLEPPLPSSAYTTLFGFALGPGITLITGLTMLSAIGAVRSLFDTGHNGHTANGIVCGFRDKSLGNPTLRNLSSQSICVNIHITILVENAINLDNQNEF